VREVLVGPGAKGQLSGVRRASSDPSKRGSCKVGNHNAASLGASQTALATEDHPSISSTGHAASPVLGIQPVLSGRDLFKDRDSAGCTTGATPAPCHSRAIRVPVRRVMYGPLRSEAGGGTRAYPAHTPNASVLTRLPAGTPERVPNPSADGPDDVAVAKHLLLTLSGVSKTDPHGGALAAWASGRADQNAAPRMPG
jgi:hypothetical protein